MKVAGIKYDMHNVLCTTVLYAGFTTDGEWNYLCAKGNKKAFIKASS